MQYNRGGKSLKVGNIGKMSCLRQHLLYPGEKMNTSLKGNVRLAGLRQQTSVYLHASIEAFAAPLRWYWDDFPDYIKEGVSTVKTIPVLTGADWVNHRSFTSNLGIGALHADFCKWFAQHPINIWNEHYRWGEDAKESVDTPDIDFFDFQGKACVNLPQAASRMHDLPTFSAGLETSVPSAVTMDVRTLALYQARFAQAAKTDWTSQERYNIFMKDVFGAKGNNEVDKVPIKLRSGAQLGVSPRDMYATDGPSLGEIMSINNFQVNHKWDGFIAQEHMIVAYMMLLRFSPVMEDGTAPGVYPAYTNYMVYQGDPNVLAGSQPLAVASLEIDGGGSGVTVGYLPAGWQLREGFNHVDFLVSDLNTFPLMDGQPLTAAGYRDASLINTNVFRSNLLRNWFADLDFSITVNSRAPEAGKSVMAGAAGKGGTPKGNHPIGGNLV